ncbi:BON domain-containing protein [Cereibacter sphaeroides]|uniref:BON domain-containing protein n=1 Tax=Cereibacter sphaeroides TaxID=1063 RepID=UPI001F2B9BD9|nr:BON domain-containing protein [Cereibacter sphaeroides]MCE6961669.1 BON domain-containing protein [Cereibacter sphaeroides]MCE6975019.1 BON domain-containing protein [Cereibacter sphaeroides]
MAQSRFEGRQRGWNDEDRGYAGDRFREERDEGYRSRDDSRQSQRYGGRDDRDRYRDRSESRYQDRGPDDYGALGSDYDRWQEGRGGQRGGYGTEGSGGYGFGGQDQRQDRSRSDYGSGYGRGDYGSGFGRSENWSAGGGRDQGPDAGFTRGGDYGGDAGRSWSEGSRFGSDRDRFGQGYGQGNRGYGQGYGERRGSGGYGGERGFMERAADEVMSWMGDEDASRRREADHRGKGPRGYQRSDERIRDEVNDRLSDDWRVDASDIEVSISNGEITLSGEVASKMEKRRAEDCADSVSGVRHVQNNLRVRDPASRSASGQTGESAFGSPVSGSSASGVTGTGAGTRQASGTGQTASGSATGGTGSSATGSGLSGSGTSGTGSRDTQA